MCLSVCVCVCVFVFVSVCASVRVCTYKFVSVCFACLSQSIYQCLCIGPSVSVLVNTKNDI